MYEKHFALKKRPFRANATGTDVFVGPQIAATMTELKKALTTTDAIVTVSGPVGCGKTTLVNHALESFDKNRKTVLVARMRLDIDDVLELLLNELGVQEIPNGVIQKFALFRRHLKELAQDGIRVFVAIEDGVRLGVDTLAEIEALTAADAGESDGASIVVMGDETLDALLREAPLARLQQRIRQRLAIDSLPIAEMRGYLKHCFHLAGREFEQVFEANAAELLHHLSSGIPRISNNLVESAMIAAADQDLDQVATTLLARIAENEYGLSAAGLDLPPQPAAALVEEPAENPSSATPAAAGIPELIQDTLPVVEPLAPELAVVDEEPLPKPEPVATAGDKVPAWERDPTMAELRPDLDALEQAMAFAQSNDPEPVEEAAGHLPEPKPEVPDEIPEITLDHAISQGIEQNLIDEPGEVSAPAPEEPPAQADDTGVPTLDLPPEQPKKADPEIENIATGLSKAKSIEDVDDKMAETLFGEEISFVAANILANPPSTEPANDELNVVVATGQQVANGSPAAGIEATPTPPQSPANGGMDPAAMQRLETVRALNAEPRPPLEMPTPTPTPTPDTKAESFEEQINTSMTQTLKALNVTPPIIDDDDDDDDDEHNSGFFSRFKRP